MAAPTRSRGAETWTTEAGGDSIPKEPTRKVKVALSPQSWRWIEKQAERYGVSLDVAVSGELELRRFDSEVLNSSIRNLAEGRVADDQVLQLEQLVRQMRDALRGGERVIADLTKQGYLVEAGPDGGQVGRIIDRSLELVPDEEEEEDPWD